MRGPKPNLLMLSEEEKTELERLVRRHTTPQHHALRARIILAAAEGKTNSKIARELDVCVDTVRAWRGRWLELQAISLSDLDEGSRLVDLPRPGAPAGSPPSKPASCS